MPLSVGLVPYTDRQGNQCGLRLSRTITRSYDNLDRLTGETTAQGSITYGYDNGSRLTSMQVAGQPQVSYTYDNADRVTQISQSSSTTSLAYDTANRRTSLTLPNGVVVSYGYDNDSHLTGITYQFGSTTLGNLTYSYDSLDRRTQVGGSFTRTGLPGAISSATYDAANELSNWNGTTISYDLNGNMLGDGTNAFTWNARNQVAKLNNVSLQYDVFGRRTQNAAGTSFLYNGSNAVQELSGTTATANLLSGGIDEVFSRTDSSGAFMPLKDALGSTIALVDSSGNVPTSYTYDPFGNTSVTGTSNGNEFQYTGRENENNGLYYYRARYYSPLVGRFVSEDPLGFGANTVNFYEYVYDSPMNYADNLGLQPMTPGEVGNRFKKFLDWLDSFSDTQDMTEDYFLGTGPAHRDFGPETVQVRSMQYAQGTIRARNYFYEKNKGGRCGSLQPVTDYQAGFGLSGLWNAGLDPTQQLVGNYRVDIIPNNDGTATFYLNNTTSMTSFLYGIGPSYSRDTFRPGGNMSQTFHWTEPVPDSLYGRGCGCK